MCIHPPVNHILNMHDPAAEPLKQADLREKCEFQVLVYAAHDLNHTHAE